jgi:hypothetical protein
MPSPRSLGMPRRRIGSSLRLLNFRLVLKYYEPQKDKRFSGSVKLPHNPRPKMMCMLGDAQHVEEVSRLVLSIMNFRSLTDCCDIFYCHLPNVL